MKFNINPYYTELGGSKNHVFQRNYFYQCDDNLPNHIASFKQKYNNIDCFQCLYYYSKLDKDALLYAPFYLDLDSDITTDKKYEKIRPYISRAYMVFLKEFKLKEDEIDLYFSGSKGFHITIDPRVLGIVPNKDLNAIYKAWAIHIALSYDVPIIDMKIYDKRRLFRMPNTINSKTGLYKVKINQDMLYSFSYSDLKKYASEQHPIQETSHNINMNAALYFYEKSKNYNRRLDNARLAQQEKDKNFEIPEEKQPLLPCIKTILEEGSIQGSRNNTLIILASGLLQSGYQLEEVEDIALKWNQINDPPLTDGEVTTTVHSAYAMLKSGRRYGCSSIKEMGLCSSNKCKLGELR